ncbi:STAS domain-containing protein [Actinoplanes sp. NPDC049316]|uniref:STAS domain-containing protein n=1 Tax=Actinoplanes sp. NPDC049316 TaxID=3154727 RepID=UPI00343B7BE3
MTSFTNDGSRLHAAVHCDGDHTIVTLTGELDRISGPPLARLLDLAADGTSAHLDLRMAQLGFIDVAGVRLLLHARRLAADRGVVLTAHDPQPHVRWLISTLDATGLLLDDSAPTAAAMVRPPGSSSFRTGPVADLRDERDRRADERDQRADERDRLANARDQRADEREEQADDRDRLAAERDRLLDDRQRRIRDHQRWADIREDLADAREDDLERREHEG